jgi:Tol biopolymer transport system component
VKSRHLVLAIVLFLMIGQIGCSSKPEASPTAAPVPSPTLASTLTARPPTVSSTLIPSPAPTQTLIPSSTPIPTSTPLPPTVTATATSTIAPWPTLSPQGPYLLVYAGRIDDRITLDILNPEGQGRKVIQLPGNGILYNESYLDQLVSPDGKWLAFHIINEMGMTLNLLHLPDGAIQYIAEVLPVDFQEGQNLIATALPTLLPTDMIPESGWTSLDLGLMEGIKYVSWSPDSRYLAFAGQIDGPSSDLYLYDLQTSSTQRLSDDLLNIHTIYWSPDGIWVLYANLIPGNIYSGDTLYAIQLGDTPVKDPKPLYTGFFWMGWGWLSPTLHVITGAWDGGQGNVRYINIETDAIQDLWPRGYDAYAWDPQSQHIYVSCFDDEEGIGTYEVSLDASYKKLTGEVFGLLIYRGNKTHLLVGVNSEYSKAIALTQNGGIVSLSERSEPVISISPDDRWMVIYNDDGIDLLDENDQWIRTIDNLGVSGTSLMWRPDSAGFYFASGSSIDYVDVPNGEPMRVDICPNGDCYLYYHQFVWLP